MSKHHCHWPGCPQVVPPKLWGCRQHWFMLPKHLRDLIWATYRPGQEITKTPSEAYIQAAIKVQQWIREYGIQAERGCEACGMRLMHTRLHGFVCPRCR